MENKQKGVSAPVQHTPPQPSEQEAPSAVQAEAASAGAAGQPPVESGRSSAERVGQPSEQGAPPAAQELSAPEKGVQPAEGGQYSKAALKKQRRKNIVWGVIAAVIIACVISVLFQLSQTLAGGDAATFAEVMRGMNWWLLLPVAALFIIMFVMETLKFTILGKTGGYPLSFGKGAKVALVGKFYECITPFSSGGQPMQIYYMYRQGIPATAATSVTMVKYGIHMLGFTFVAALVMGFGVPQLSAIPDEAMRTTVLVCGWVGFGINAFIPVFVTIVVFLPGLVKWVVNLFVKMLHAVRIVKNPDKWEAKMRQWIDDFAAISQFIYKKPKEFFVLFLLCLGEPSIELIQPYLLLVAMRPFGDGLRGRAAFMAGDGAGDVLYLRRHLYPHPRQFGRHRNGVHGGVRGAYRKRALLVCAHLALCAVLYLADLGPRHERLRRHRRFAEKTQKTGYIFIIRRKK